MHLCSVWQMFGVWSAYLQTNCNSQSCLNASRDGRKSFRNITPEPSTLLATMAQAVWLVLWLEMLNLLHSSAFILTREVIQWWNQYRYGAIRPVLMLSEAELTPPIVWCSLEKLATLLLPANHPENWHPRVGTRAAASFSCPKCGIQLLCLTYVLEGHLRGSSA